MSPSQSSHPRFDPMGNSVTVTQPSTASRQHARGTRGRSKEEPSASPVALGATGDAANRQTALRSPRARVLCGGQPQQDPPRMLSCPRCVGYQRGSDSPSELWCIMPIMHHRCEAVQSLPDLVHNRSHRRSPQRWSPRGPDPRLCHIHFVTVPEVVQEDVEHVWSC